MVEDQDSKQDDHDVSSKTEGVGPTPNANAAPSMKEPSRPHSVSSAPSGIVAQPAPKKWSSDEAVAQSDLPDVPLRFSEKKRLHWSDKTCM